MEPWYVGVGSVPKAKVKADAAGSLAAGLQQILQELRLGEAVKVE